MNFALRIPESPEVLSRLLKELLTLGVKTLEEMKSESSMEIYLGIC